MYVNGGMLVLQWRPAFVRLFVSECILSILFIHKVGGWWVVGGDEVMSDVEYGHTSTMATLANTLDCTGSSFDLVSLPTTQTGNTWQLACLSIPTVSRLLFIRGR